MRRVPKSRQMCQGRWAVVNVGIYFSLHKALAAELARVDSKEKQHLLHDRERLV